MPEHSAAGCCTLLLPSTAPHAPDTHYKAYHTPALQCTMHNAQCTMHKLAPQHPPYPLIPLPLKHCIAIPSPARVVARPPVKRDRHNRVLPKQRCCCCWWGRVQGLTPRLLLLLLSSEGWGRVRCLVAGTTLPLCCCTCKKSNGRCGNNESRACSDSNRCKCI
jgi:hypothetical protein